jgi:hypothetical protein
VGQAEKGKAVDWRSVSIPASQMDRLAAVKWAGQKGPNTASLVLFSDLAQTLSV